MQTDKWYQKEVGLLEFNSAFNTI